MTVEPTAHQQVIIDHPLEPLRVTAGAGTGKTTTISKRLAALVAGPDVAPERTLGITFTNKAAYELGEAIRAELDTTSPEGEVEVTTYHGFAFGIVTEFGPLLGIPRTVRIATPGYVRQLLRDALGATEREHLDLTNPGGIVDRLLGLSSSLGDHLLSPNALMDASPAELRAERAEIATVLDTFAKRKRDLGVVDYADLVTLAHRIVTDHEEIGQRIRSRYQLVLLDEYQDTNPGQRELLRVLFGDGFPITAVGDSDQTIYEWRGASTQNFENFPDDFPNATGEPAASLVLPTCWRSGHTIIGVANAVRDQLTSPGPLPELLPRPDAAPGEVRTHWLRTAVDEARWIADEIIRLREETDCAWSDVAILFRKHRQMTTIRDALTAAGVPVEVASLGGLLEVPEVADVHAWLRIIGRPDDAPALSRILLGAHHRLGLGDIAPLTDWIKARRKADEEASIGWALLEAIDELEAVTGLRDEARRRLARFRSRYRELLVAAQSASLVEICRLILDRTGAWPEIDALPEAARTSARLNVYRFLDLAEDWSPLEGRPSLDAFLEHLEALSAHTAAEELDTARVSGEDAVAMLTVHRAKGLEWQVVILPALAADTFPSRVLRFEDPFTDAFELPHEVRLDRDALPRLDPDDREQRRGALRRRHSDAEWRTAYVAVTRAKSSLIGTGAWWYTDGRSKRPSPLFDTIDAAADAVPGRSPEAGDPPDALRFAHDATSGPDPHFEAGPTALLASAAEDPSHLREHAGNAGILQQYDAEVEQLRIELAGLPEPVEPEPEDAPFRTSVTGLVTVAGCPLRFRWEHIDRLPRRPSAAAKRGTELHRRIELHHRGTIAFEEATPEFYDDVTGGGAAAPVPGAFDRFLASRFAARRPVLVEAPFDLKVGRGVVSGRIDAVYETDDGGWEIVDFKSGRNRSSPGRRVQLEAYAVAADEVDLLAGGQRPTSTAVTFAYFGGPETEEVSEPVTPTWLEAAGSHLAELVAVAEEGPYDPEPGPQCHTCDFVRFCNDGRAWLEDQA